MAAGVYSRPCRGGPTGVCSARRTEVGPGKKAAGRLAPHMRTRADRRLFSPKDRSRPGQKGGSQVGPPRTPQNRRQPRWGRGPNCGRKRRDVAGQETARPAVGQGPHLREEATRCRRARNRTARGGAGAPPAGGSDEMSPGKKHSAGRRDLNLRRQTPADLQSAPFGRSGIPANVPTLGDEIGDYSKARKSVSHGVADEPGKGTQPAGLRSEGPPTGCPLPSSRDDRYGLSSAGAC